MNQVMEPQTLLSSAEVAARLNLDRSTITRRAQSGTLPYVHRLATATGAYLFDARVIDEIAARNESGKNT